MGTRHMVVGLALVALVTMAGCLIQPTESPLAPGGGGSTGASPDVGPVPAGGPGSSSMSSNGRTGAVNPTGVARRTPWDSSAVVVGVEAPDNTTLDVVGLVNRTIQYWERIDQRYADYVVDFVLDPDAKSPDIVVEFTDSVTCHGTTGWLGCAPKLNATSEVAPTEVVQIKAGMTANKTLGTLKHEFGHLLGVEHGEPPMPLMAASRVVSSGPRPDAVEREFPWRKERITVFIDYAQLRPERRDEVRSELRSVIEYYDAGKGDVVPRDVDVVEVDDKRTADIVVKFPDERWCGEGAGSCGYTWGTNLDTDDPVEFYTSSSITLVDIPADRIGWHFGHWLGRALGAETSEEMPPVFRVDNRSAWSDRSERVERRSDGIPAS